METHLIVGFVWEDRLKALTRNVARMLALKKFKEFFIVYFLSVKVKIEKPLVDEDSIEKLINFER